MWKDRILLSLVEAMDLVDEEDRSQAGSALDSGFRHDLSEVRNSGGDSRDRHQSGFCLCGQQARQRRLAAAWRAPQHDAGQVAGAGQLPQHLDNPSLPDQIVKGLRAHPGGQRGRRLIPRRGLKKLALIPHAQILNRRVAAEAASEVETGWFSLI